MEAVLMIVAAYLAWEYGTSFGYKIYLFSNPIYAAFTGGSVIFFGVFLIGRQLLDGIVRDAILSIGTNAANLGLGWRRRHQAPAGPVPAGLAQSINRGMPMVYEGLVNRDFPYMDGNRTKKARIRASYTLTRNTMAMSPRERQAVEILMTLRAEGRLGRVEDRLNLALTYGDGKCQIKGPGFKCDPRVMQYNNFKSVGTLVANEVENRSANVEGAITELFGMLQDAAAWPHASEAVKKLLRRLQQRSDDDDDSQGSGRIDL